MVLKTNMDVVCISDFLVTLTRQLMSQTFFYDHIAQVECRQQAQVVLLSTESLSYEAGFFVHPLVWIGGASFVGGNLFSSFAI